MSGRLIGNVSPDVLAALYQNFPKTAALLEGRKARWLLEKTPEDLRVAWVDLMRELIETYAVECDHVVARNHQVLVHDAIMNPHKQ